MLKLKASESSTSTRSGISKSYLIAGGVLWLCVAIAIGLSVRKIMQRNAGVSAESGDGGASVEGSDKPSEDNTITVADTSKKSVIFSMPARELPPFEFPDCMGETVSRDSLKGHPWVASFVFTRCTTSCPMITKAVMDLHQSVGKVNPDVRFVSFSVDSNYDTPEILKKYSDNFSADHERWKFLTGDEAAIHDIIIKGFSQYVKPNAGEARLPGFEVAHSNRVVLVNEDSIPVATFLGTKEVDMLELRQILEGKREFPKPGPLLRVEGDDPSSPSIQLQLVPSEGSGSESDSTDGGSNSSSGGGKTSGQGGGGDVESEFHFTMARVAFAGEEELGHAGKAESRNEKIDRLMPSWTKVFPTLNASLNGMSTILLLMGFVSIKRGNRLAHRNLMISAFLVSVLFLGSYLSYHYLLGKYSGEHGRQFEGADSAKTLYFSILIPHVLLAVSVPVLAIRVFQHAFAKRWEKHRKLAKIAFPIWLFVSVTGVVIYWMLYHWPWKTAVSVVV
ncbi:MAG: DUF420 domain-containing protein [Planctomyces sp.]|nr:DUF420 domain-containing protein [Planctomyces sp.]